MDFSQRELEWTSLKGSKYTKGRTRPLPEEENERNTNGSGNALGNLGDMSPRAVEALRQADFIAAEDTRVTLKLLNHFEIKSP